MKLSKQKIKKVNVDMGLFSLYNTLVAYREHFPFDKKFDEVLNDFINYVEDKIYPDIESENGIEICDEHLISEIIYQEIL